MGYILDPEQQELRALDDLVDFAGKDVLEPGCGDGRLTWRYAPRAASVLAIDPDAGAVEKARRQAPAGTSANVAFRVGDLFATDLPRSASDVVLFSGTL